MVLSAQDANQGAMEGFSLPHICRRTLRHPIIAKIMDVRMVELFAGTAEMSHTRRSSSLWTFCNSRPLRPFGQSPLSTPQYPLARHRLRRAWLRLGGAVERRRRRLLVKEVRGKP